MTLNQNRRLLLLLAVVCYSLGDLSAQHYGGAAMRHVNEQLRDLFVPINNDNPTVASFYDMTAHVMDSGYWSNQNLDTLDLSTWEMLYEELWWSQYDTLTMPTIQSYFQQVKSDNDTVEIGLMNYSFNRFVDSTVFGDTTYFYFDTVSNELIDNPYRSISPYIVDTLFAVTTLQNSVPTLYVTYKIDPGKFILDGNHAYGTGKKKLEIDFGDGNGNIFIDTDTITFHEVTYPGPGQVDLRAITTDVNGVPIDFSQFTYTVFGQTFVTPDFPDSIYLYAGMQAGFYNPCNTNDPNYESKYIIFIEGFDYFKTSGIHDNYVSRFKNTGLAELRNHGYTVVIVNWQSPAASIQSNAGKVVKLLDNLICQNYSNVDVPHQFVVMGASMGGLIARYALLDMEFRDLNTCRDDLMHNTRLFISIDAPQRGAYVPVAFQEMFETVNPNLSVYSKTLSYTSVRRMRDIYDALSSTPAKQMLLHHISSATAAANNYTATNYDPHALRAALEDEFAFKGPLNGGYPQFCKKLAITNGLLTGEHVERAFNELGEAQPGDNLMLVDGDRYIVILGKRVKLFSTEITMNSVNGSNDIFHWEAGLEHWAIRMVWKRRTVGNCPICVKIPYPDGVAVDLDYTVSLNRYRYPTPMLAYDVMPGGVYGYDHVLDTINAYNDWWNSWTPFEGRIQNEYLRIAQDVRFFVFDNLHKVDFSFTTQVPGFSFIPMQSALDYDGGGLLAPLDHDIYNENIVTKLSRTPFDVIVGEVNGLPGYPQERILSDLDRNRFFFPARNRGHVTLFNHQLNLMLSNSSSSTPLFSYYLNREIGDEELWIENLTLNRPAFFEAEYEISGGTNLNPYYAYPNQTAQQVIESYSFTIGNPNNFGYDLSDNGMFSKDETFTIQNQGLATLKAENAVNDFGITGTWNPLLQQQLVCILDFFCFGGNCKDDGMQREVFQNAEWQALIYPNPVSAGAMLTLECGECEIRSGRIFNTNGVLVGELPAATHIRQINLAPLHLTAGIYFIQLESKSESKTYKLMVQ